MKTVIHTRISFRSFASCKHQFLARDVKNIYISRLCHDASQSVRLSVRL